jgi:GTP-binding protein
MSTDFQTNRALFLDKIRIQVAGGDGGDGCASYARTLDGIGGPNGGNGGAGGDVFLYTDPNMSTFGFSTYHFKAGRGGAGGSDNLNGSVGNHMTIKIPPGTIIREIVGRDALSNQVKTRFLADLSEPDMTVRVARGANGGYGNRTFKASDRPKAQFTTVGETGGPHRYELELKTIADIGLVGFPNAGKSSLLAAVSNAEPKIANYPFTTLSPMVGNVNIAKFTDRELIYGNQLTKLNIADIPGLVDGAHMNVGLGHEFLRHIERTKVLLYVVDLARPLKSMKTAKELQEKHQEEMRAKQAEIHLRKTEEDARLDKILTNRREKMQQQLKQRGIPEEEYGRYSYHDFFPKDQELEDVLINHGTERIYQDDYQTRPRNIHVTDLGDPVEEFLALRRELALYQPELAARPSIVFANKSDKHSNAFQSQLQRLTEAVPRHWPVFTGSAKTGEGLKPLIETCGEMLQFINMEVNSDLIKLYKYQDLTDTEHGGVGNGNGRY